MKLSVVIVNYNVKYFLKQCLASVYGSERTLADGEELQLEVWVVDNDSVDGSVEMVRRDFPEVQVIENKENVGFAKANNMALKQAAGDALLLLNPDTVVERDTFVRCADFLQSHTDCGGLTVKMVDGRGRFLKESKRGFPTPQASFYKISGLIKLMPRSRRVAAYYMGHLPEDETNEIEILPGAFLMLRREVYEKIGGLDESYFMYGEDIDFSWRIRLAGWKNYYLPETHIIHYKGESTRKGSMNYVYTFYNAMSIFVKRYFSGGGARLFTLLLHLAIWLRAAGAWAGRIARRAALPLFDLLTAWGGFVLLKMLWEHLKGVGPDYYPAEYTLAVIPLYVLILMASSWLNGGYDKPVRMGRIARGMGIGVLLLLAFYSLLDESQRYSRMLLLLGSAWTLTSALLTRVVLGMLGVKGYALRTRTRSNIVVVGGEQERARIEALYRSLGVGAEQIASTSDTDPERLQKLLRIEHADEVIFCGRDIDLKQIIELMAQLRTSGVEYRIAPTDSDFIIGSDSILSADSLLIADLDTISTDTSRRTKRTFDLVTALLLTLLSPILFWFQRRKGRYFADCLSVLVGRQTWVGYTGHRGVFSPADMVSNDTPELAERLTLRYMRHYRAATDFAILARNWRNL